MLPLFILTTILFAFIAIFFAYQLDQKEEKAKHQEEMNLFMIHELRSPLSSIKSAASLLLQNQKIDETAKQSMFNLIHNQSIRLLEYISILLDTARFESGTFSLQMKPNDIKSVLKERIDLLQPLVIEKEIPINLDIKQPIPSFRFDKEYISHVIDNLLYNALKFTPKGGKIDVLVDLEHTFVSICVENSASMNVGQQEHLFTKFSPTASSESKGSGLGLYFVKGIVEAHGGKVSLSSDDQTTRISFSLPFISTKI